VTTSPPFVVPASRVKALKLLAIAALLIAGGLRVLRMPGAWLGFAGVAVLAFAGVCGAYCLYRLVRPGLAVVVDAGGIVDHASAVAVGRIRWDQIEAVFIFDFLGQTMLGIAPRDPKRFIRNQPLWRRPFLHANMGLGCPPINIPEVMLPVSAGEVLAAIEEFSGRTWPTRS
jgi:hypothetical protein